jgi:hypothetical protein
MTINVLSAKIIIFTPLMLIQFLSVDAHAQAIADNMTCKQAINYYERNGRISKFVHGKNVIPIYNGVAVSKRRQLKCSTTAIKFKTTDNARCPVAYKCMPRTGR